MHPSPRPVSTVDDTGFSSIATPIKNIVQIVIFALLVCSNTALSLGSYTATGSRALADSNPSGAYLIAGDRKVLLRKDGLEAGFQVTQSLNAEPSIVTGALLSTTTQLNHQSAVRAIICINVRMYDVMLNQDGTSRLTQTDLQTTLELEGVRDLRCAVNRNSGQWIAVNIRNGKVLFSGGKTAYLQNYGRSWTHAVSLDDRFLVFGEGSSAVQIAIGPDANAEYPINSIAAPWSNLENRDTLATRGNAILRTGDSQTSLTYLEVSEHEPRWTDPMTIPLSPCAETGGCGAHLAPDGRWIIAGSWGTFVGRAANFSRIKTPLLSSDATSPGAALINDKGQYILVGDIDTDIGALPEQAALARFINTENFQKFSATPTYSYQTHVVWKKRTTQLGLESSAATQERVLFPYSPHTNSNRFAGDVVVIKGSLPKDWPHDWVAIEPQTNFLPLALSSEWTPASSLPPPSTFQSAWWAQKMGFKQASELIRERGISLSPVKVAIVDSGIDLLHPAFRTVLHQNTAEIPDNGLDDDKNGLIDDVIGYDFVTEQPEPTDPFGHGTHVAGLVSNVWAGKDATGGAPNARLRIYRALDSSGKSNSIDLARAISAAIRSEVDLINCSWGGGPETQVLRDAFAAAQTNNILVLTSAGNDGLKINDTQPVPKNYPGVTPIGAATARDSRARFSNWGDKVVFGFAPGVDITSTLPGSQFGEKSGTSMSSPIAVSATAILLGIIKEARPEWSKRQQGEQALHALCSSANKKKLQKGQSKCGLLSAEASVDYLFRALSDLR